MYLVFMDEAGYQPEWKEHIDEQPFYVASAVCLPCDVIPGLYEGFRDEIADLKLPGHKKVPLGRGYEIKAKAVATGSGYWGTNENARNAVRDLFLSAPRKNKGVAFVAIVDKEKHNNKYVTPDDPDDLALRFVFERIEWFLKSQKRPGYCIYDQNKRIEQTVHTRVADILTTGSSFDTWKGLVYTGYDFEFDKIQEVAMGDSRFSIGLQIADFFATFTYQFFKGGRRPDCGWWTELEKSLRKGVGGKIHGYGMKVFP